MTRFDGSHVDAAVRHRSGPRLVPGYNGAAVFLAAAIRPVRDEIVRSIEVALVTPRHYLLRENIHVVHGPTNRGKFWIA